MNRIILLIFSILLVCISLPAEEQKEPILFYHEDYGTPQLNYLLDEFDFDDTIVSAETEFEQITALKNWVFYNIDFKHNYPMGALRNALSILRYAETGKSFHCVHFAATFMQCSLSLGWTTRYMFVQNIKNELHAINEIWSNQYNKWIMIDVTWNIHIEVDGIPLSGLEIRNEWIKNNGQDLVYVFGTTENEAKYLYEDLPVSRDDNNAWIWWPLDDIYMTYFYEIAYIGRNNFFSSGDGNGSNIYDYVYIIKDELNENDYDWDFRFSEDIDDMNALYHDINRIDISYDYIDWDTVQIKLDAFGEYNYTPNLKNFLIRIDDGEWHDTSDSFFWNLNDGRNVLYSRIENKFNRLGPVYQIEIIN